MKLRHLFFLSAFAALVASCRYTAPDFQQEYTTPAGGWKYDYQPKFSFAIDDTASAYQLYLIMRHTNAYPYSNIWLRLKSKWPGDTTFQREERREVMLAEAPGVNADGSRSGKWLGRGMGEIVEQARPLYTLQQPLYFPHKGTYEILMAQDMRVNPLPDVLLVGLRLQKIGQLAAPTARPAKDSSVTGN